MGGLVWRESLELAVLYVRQSLAARELAGERGARAPAGGVNQVVVWKTDRLSLLDFLPRR